MDNNAINNKIILLRKSLKSIVSQTKLNLIKKIKKDKEKNKATERKESELICFQNGRIKTFDIPLSSALYPEKLQKLICADETIEIERVHARILLNPIVQKSLNDLKNKFGIDTLEKFLKTNDKRLKKAGVKRISNTPITDSDKKEKLVKSSKGSSGKVRDAKSSKIKKSRKEPDNAENEEEKATEKAVDLFFLSSNGQNYMSSITTADSTESDDSEELKYHDVRISKKVPNDSSKIYDNKRTTKLRSEAQKKSQSEAVDKNNVKEDMDLIHPSWKAKQQMKKNQIVEFKGTKIKFDE